MQEPCQLRSVLAGGLEVQDPLQEMAVITNVSFTSEQYTSLLAMLLDGAVFLFVGTNTGKVHQVHIVVVSANDKTFVLSPVYPLLKGFAVYVKILYKGMQAKVKYAELFSWVIAICWWWPFINTVNSVAVKFH